MCLSKLLSVLISYYEKIGDEVTCIDNEIPFEIPENWCWVRLENISSILDCNRIPVSLSEREKRILDKGMGQLYPYYGATGLVGYIDDYIFDGEYILLGEDGAPFLDKTAEKAYMVKGKCWINNHAHVLNPYIDNMYFLSYLNSINYSNHVHGTTRLKLTQADMCKILISVPPASEQLRIVALVNNGLSYIQTIEASLR